MDQVDPFINSYIILHDSVQYSFQCRCAFSLSQSLYALDGDQSITSLHATSRNLFENKMFILQKKKLCKYIPLDLSCITLVSQIKTSKGKINI